MTVMALHVPQVSSSSTGTSVEAGRVLHGSTQQARLRLAIRSTFGSLLSTQSSMERSNVSRRSTTVRKLGVFVGSSEAADQLAAEAAAYEALARDRRDGIEPSLAPMARRFVRRHRDD